MSVLDPGTIIGGRYRVERELAQGGFGAVYIATHTVTEERVALKVLWPHVLKSKDSVERFQFEATVAAKVASENIVRVLDAGFDDTQKMPFLVMELLKGKTLEDMVLHEGPMRPLEVVSVLAQTANALDKAHNYRDAEGRPRPIVHRDLKPENLFFARRENGDPCVKILDFGIAKVLSDTAKVSQEAKGTPIFMAYEQLTGAPVSPATDVWALGLIAFFLLTGKSYWATASNPEADIHALFAELITSTIEAPSLRSRQLGAEPSWSAAFDAWFQRCVDREPSRRFQSAGEAIRELGLALEAPESSPESPAMVKARTMVATRYHLDQSIPPTQTSQTHSGLSTMDRAGLARLQGSSPSAPALSQTPSMQMAVNPMPLLYGAFGLALLAIGALVFVLMRPTPAAPEPPRGALAAVTPSAASTEPPPASSQPPAPSAPAASVLPRVQAVPPPTPKTKPTSVSATTATTTPAPTAAPTKADPFIDR